jgi:sn-glycerol 3-phosphate transport system substrate-binding protein
MLRRTLLAASIALGATSLAAAQTTELVMYYPVQVGGPITKIIDGYVAGFEAQNPDVKIQSVYSGSYADTHTKALTALKGGQPLHLAVLLAADLHSYVNDGLVVAAEDLATTAEEKAWLNAFYPAFLANSRRDGKIWAVPFQRSTAVMYWNKQAFKEAGLDPEKPPRTWAEMAEMGAKVMKRDAAGNVGRWGVFVPSNQGTAQWLFGAMAYQNGEQRLMNEAGSEVYLNAPRSIEALQYWVDLSRKHKVMPEGVVEWATTPAAFLEEKVAMIWHTTGNLTFIKERAKFDFGVAHLPGKDSPRSVVGGGNFYVFKNATPAQQKAALRFMRYLTEPERAADWSIKTGYVAVSPAAYEVPAMKAHVQTLPAAIVARDQLPLATGEISVLDNQRVWKILNDGIQAAIMGRSTPEQAMTAAQTQATQALRRSQ